MHRAVLVATAAAGLIASPTLAGAAPDARVGADVRGVAAQVLPAGLPRLPPSPPLAPEAARAGFTLPPGFRIELVAAEPLVQSPVAIAFDARGRLWVVEMRGFMPDAAGRGEDAPSGRVAILEDSDGDGRMDRRKEFLDGLVLPRSVAFAGGGVLIAAPPQLLFCRDAGGHGGDSDRCDRPQVVSTSYGTAKNPEHDANGLQPAIDNWLYSANLDQRHRFLGGRLVTAPTISRGQWGIAQDDVGRLVYNTNSDYLRGDALPAFTRAAHLRQSRGLNVVLDPDRSTWPARPNHGVNRGYQSGLLRADGTLSRFTAACGPHVYRGDQFPPAYRGNAFVAEPAANLVRRSVITQQDGGGLAAHNAHARGEFLTSTDERFRPVNLATGPEGALYVVDMYRGLIQHRIYLTKFLRQQVAERGLEAPVDRGRIWRVVSDAAAPAPPPKLAGASDLALVAQLAHPSGFWRDTAQRLLVERQPRDRATLAALERLVARAPDPRARLHALFVLEGLGRLDVTGDGGTRARGGARRLLARAGQDRDRFVRAAALALVERGEEARLAALAVALAGRARLDAAALARVRGRELDLLGHALATPAWAAASEGRAHMLAQLGARVAARGAPAELLQLLELVTAEPREAAWRQAALLTGVAQGRRGGSARLPEPPRGWARVLRSDDPAVSARAQALAAWVGEPVPAATTGAAARALNADERARFARGKALFPGICGACHHPSGGGDEGKGPPLVDSPWVLGPVERLVRITLHGLRGPVKVNNRVYEMEMPAMGALDDAALADLLTYVRTEKEWGHEAGPVDPATVARVRKQVAEREAPWTEAELLKLDP
jgi:mono/diheme cytochrome c family protein/glucose/arabinose dehydrogenase